MMGLFGDLFDFNNDGKLDGFEKTAEFATFSSMMDKLDADSSDNEESEIEMAALDELEFMDESWK